MSHPMAAQDQEWQAESDLRTLTEMDKLKREPERVRRAKDLALRKAEEAKRVAGSIKTPRNDEGSLRRGFRKLG